MARNAPKIYKHSNAKTIIFKVIAVIIAAAVILALTAFFGFRKFIAYTETGKLYLDIPWLYGYIDGPPAEDDLAPYLEPVNPTPESITKTEETEDEPQMPSEPAETDEPSENDVPQYVDPNANSENIENDQN